jgi:hypothetical protein
VRITLVSAALGILGVFAACGGDNDADTTPFSELDASAAEQQLNEDVVASLLGTWTIRYTATICARDQQSTCKDGDEFEFTWYKDGRERQRFDFRDAPLGNLSTFPDLPDDIQVLIPVNDRTFTTLCSSDARFFNESAFAQGEGACCEGGSSTCGEAGDTGANIVYGEMGFLLEFPEGDLTGSTAFSEENGTELIRYEERDIAGVRARCYVAGRTDERTVELCYAPDGAELYRDGFTPFARVRLEATNVEDKVEDKDFDPPYRVIPNE